MKAAPIFVFLLILMMMSMVDSQCPIGWSIYFAGRVCYKFFPGERKYYDAYQLCKEQGGEEVVQKLVNNGSLP